MEARENVVHSIEQEKQKSVSEIKKKIGQEIFKHGPMPVSQPQAPTREQSIQPEQQRPLPPQFPHYAGTPPEYMPYAQPYGQAPNHQPQHSYQYPPQHLQPAHAPYPYPPQHPQPAYGYYPPQHPMPAHEQYQQQPQPPYPYQHPPVHQFQQTYGQYPDGWRPYYSQYEQHFHPMHPQQQIPPNCQFHMPPAEHYQSTPNHFGLEYLHPESSQVKPEHNIPESTDFESTLDKNIAATNSPEENLEPLVTQFNNLTVKPEPFLEKELSRKELKRAIIFYCRADKDYEPERLKFYLQQLAGNKESAKFMIDTNLATYFAYSKLWKFRDYVRVNPEHTKKYAPPADKVSLLLAAIQLVFYEMILQSKWDRFLQQREVTCLYKEGIPKLSKASSALWQLGAPPGGEVLFNTAKEAIDVIFFEWEIMKNSMLIDPRKPKLK